MDCSKDLLFFLIFFTGWTMGFITIKQPNWDHIFLELFPSVFIANPRFSCFWDSHQSKCPVKCIFLPATQIAALQRNDITQIFGRQKIGVCPARLLVEKLLLGRSYDSPKVLRSTHRHVRCFKKQHGAPFRMDFVEFVVGNPGLKKKHKVKFEWRRKGTFTIWNVGWWMSRNVNPGRRAKKHLMLFNWSRSHFSNDFC